MRFKGCRGYVAGDQLRYPKCSHLRSGSHRHDFVPVSVWLLAHLVDQQWRNLNSLNGYVPLSRARVFTLNLAQPTTEVKDG